MKKKKGRLRYFNGVFQDESVGWISAIVVMCWSTGREETISKFGVSNFQV